MKINIVSSKVLRLSIQHRDVRNSLGKEKLAYQSKAHTSESANTSEPANDAHEKQALFGARVQFFDEHFCVVFKTEIHTDEGMCIDLEYESRFDVSVPVDEDFKSSNFPFINAPAIAYPYLRAFISNLTLNAGYAPVMLPSLNFVAMKDRIKAASV